MVTESARAGRQVEVHVFGVRDIEFVARRAARRFSELPAPASFPCFVASVLHCFKGEEFADGTIVLKRWVLDAEAKALIPAEILGRLE